MHDERQGVGVVVGDPPTLHQTVHTALGAAVEVVRVAVACYPKGERDREPSASWDASPAGVHGTGPHHFLRGLQFFVAGAPMTDRTVGELIRNPPGDSQDLGV